MLDPEGLGELRRDRHRRLIAYLGAIRIAPSRRIDLAVEHRVLDDVHGQRAVLVGVAEPGRVRHLLAERLLRLLGQRAEQRRLEQAGRDGADPDELARQVAGDRQRHADDAALGRRVRGLADLALEGGDRRGVDDDAALLADAARSWRSARAASRSTLNVPIRLTSMIFLNQSSGNGPSLPSVLAALPMPAQLTLMRSGPSDSATSSAWPTASSIGDVGGREHHALAELGHSFLALLQVDDDHLGARVEQRLVVARPRPEAPPVTTATASLICTDAFLSFTVMRADPLVGWDYTQSRRTASVSAPGTPGGVGVGGHAAGEPRRRRGLQVVRRSR